MNRHGTCFLCNTTATRIHYPLATFRLPKSQREVFYFLSELLGKGYLVVCDDDAVICRTCTNMLIKLDELQQETTSVKSTIMKHLEKKCQLVEESLEPGQEIPVQETPVQEAPVQEAPVQETPVQETHPELEQEPVIQKPLTFLERKKAAEESAMQELELSSDPRSRIWMKCDSCEYTCNYTSFVERHVRVEQCLQCGLEVQNGVCPTGCRGKAMAMSKLTPEVIVQVTDDSVLVDPPSDTFDVPDVSMVEEGLSEPDEEEISNGRAAYYVSENGQLREVFAVNEDSQEPDTLENSDQQFSVWV